MSGAGAASRGVPSMSHGLGFVLGARQVPPSREHHTEPGPLLGRCWGGERSIPHLPPAHPVLISLSQSGARSPRFPGVVPALEPSGWQRDGQVGQTEGWTEGQVGRARGSPSSHNFAARAVARALYPAVSPRRGVPSAPLARAAVWGPCPSPVGEGEQGGGATPGPSVSSHGRGTAQLELRFLQQKLT